MTPAARATVYFHVATYAIGDIQGCYDSLQALLKRIAFERERDRLLLVGDLVNRGPKSLQVLRWAREMDDCVTCVLGNHDIHLLMRVAGSGKVRDDDTVGEVLSAPDCDQLIDWLRYRPLVHRQDSYVLVHAGLHPDWDAMQARTLAAEIEALLRARSWRAQIGDVGRGRAPAWHPHLFGTQRLRAILAILTRMRACREDGAMAHKFAGPVSSIRAPYMPWYAVPGAKWRECQVLFGHWSALGLYRDDHCTGLDTGCVWGGHLTALCLETGEISQVATVESERELPARVANLKSRPGIRLVPLTPPGPPSG